MATTQGIKTVVGGGAPVFWVKADDTATELPKWLATLDKYGVDTIDSANRYGDSERVIGEFDVGKKFTIDTKLPGGFDEPGATTESIIKIGEESHARLKVPVDILYLHSPDTRISWETTLDAVNVLYKKGHFKRFGLSNFHLPQVKEVYALAKSKGYPLPEVYQGNFNAFARSYERELIPELRKLGISFRAYSPQAGGFLAKTADLLDTGRLHKDSGYLADMYATMYKKPKLIEGLTRWNDLATRAGIRPGDMALRWVKYNSILSAEHGDAIIVGGRTLQQLDQSLGALQDGPLPESLLAEIDRIWETVKDDAPVDNYHDFVKPTNTQI